MIRIAENLEESIPNLETLILTGNQIQDLCDIDPLIKLKSLTTLSLLQNPVSAKAHYRQYLMYKLPQLRLLDFKKIKQKERDEAHEFFKTPRGKEILKDIKKRKAQNQAAGVDKPFASQDDRNKIREAITNASSLEEVQRLSKMLQSGFIPRDDNHTNGIDKICYNYHIYESTIHFFFNVYPFLEHLKILICHIKFFYSIFSKLRLSEQCAFSSENVIKVIEMIQ